MDAEANESVAGQPGICFERCSRRFAKRTCMTGRTVYHEFEEQNFDNTSLLEMATTFLCTTFGLAFVFLYFMLILFNGDAEQGR